jgi:hypothetical protein
MIPNVIKVFYLSITEACPWRTHRQGVTQACVVSNWNLEEFEDIKGGIRIRISKKIRQHNGQKKKYKMTNKDLQNIHIKLKIE